MILPGTQVLFGAVMVLGGFYLLLNTVPKGHTFKTDTYLLNTILGILNMGVGALFVTYALFG